MELYERVNPGTRPNQLFPYYVLNIGETPLFLRLIDPR